MEHAFGEEKVARKSESVSLSHKTSARRITDLNKYVSLKLKDIMTTGWAH